MWEVEILMVQMISISRLIVSAKNVTKVVKVEGTPHVNEGTASG
jgi:hypothetical protein